MTTLHMETECVRALTSQLKQVAEAIRSQAQSLNSSTQGVDWLGPSHDEFLNEVFGLIRQLDGQAENGLVLAGRVENEVAEWEEMAACFGDTKGMQPALGAGMGYSGGGSGGGGGGSWGGWMFPFPPGSGGSIKGEKYFLLDGEQSKVYEGYLKGDLSFDEMREFLNKDPFKDKIQTSVTFLNIEESAKLAAWDGQHSAAWGTVSGSVFSTETTVTGSVNYQDGAMQAQFESEIGAYLAKGSYNATLAGVGVAAIGYLGAEASSKGTAFYDLKKGEGGIKADVEAFAGGKLEGTVTKEVGGVTGTATGSVSYGIGATAKADIGFSEGHIRTEVELGATLGLGAEIGFSVDLDVGKAASSIADAGKNAVDWLFGD